jgi:D-cysteine desulfhydrase
LRGPALALPTPVYPWAGSAFGAGKLWIKDDGRIEPRYGGNKTRKLAFVLPDVESRGARRIVTFGAAGSHHVLATSLFATELGLEVLAFLTPEPGTPHTSAVLRAIAARGVELEAAPMPLALPFAAAARLRRGDYVLHAGGAGLPATLAYAEAARELERQVAERVLPEPSEIVLPLGSGTTAAGLVAGLAATRLRTRVIAVEVATAPFARGRTLHLAARAARTLGCATAGFGARLEIVRDELGPGYGAPSARGSAAAAHAGSVGLALDPTYTAKAFAHALRRIQLADPSEVILYWHTLSSAPLEPLLAGAPEISSLPERLRRLLRPVAPQP